jgi:hypothetical protein
MDPVADHEARQRGHQLANLRFQWGECYQIGWQDGAFQAVRRDDGSPVRGITYREICDLISQDYLTRPVSPDAATRPSGPPSAGPPGAAE